MNIFVKIFFIAAIICAYTPPIHSAKILVVAPFFGKSHSIYINSIVSELICRKHEIVLITSNPLQKPPPSVRQIITKGAPSSTFESSSMYDVTQMPNLFILPFIWSKLLKTTEAYMNSTSVQEFLKEKNHKFDLVISELFMQDALYMFAHKYRAPHVLLDTSTYMTIMDDMMGQDSALSYINSEFSRDFVDGDLTLFQRVHNHIMGNIIKWGHRFYLRRQHYKLASKYFSDLPKPLPSIEELEKNVSLVLMNTHFSYDSVRPLVPGIVEIGGVHVKPPKPLPEDIKKFLDEAEDGAIYFSFGSYLESSLMPEEKMNIFFNVFKKLKQRILWKFEKELPEKMSNVMVSKWLPQADILAHPNIRIFMSHGGMLGSLEAINRGVPVLGIPVYGDQHQNMAKLSQKKMATYIRFTEVTEENLENTIKTILSDPTYMENAKAISKRYHDQQNTPMEKAMFWIEYVIRHNGAPFMQSKLVHLPWHKYYFLDVYAVYLVLSILIYLISSKLVGKKFKNFFFSSIKYTVVILAVGYAVWFML